MRYKSLIIVIIVLLSVSIFLPIVNAVCTSTGYLPGVYPSGGDYSTSQSITLCYEYPCAIFYTLNDATPTPNSSLYSGPITIDSTKTLKAAAYIQSPDGKWFTCSNMLRVRYVFPVVCPSDQVKVNGDCANVTNNNAYSINNNKIYSIPFLFGHIKVVGGNYIYLKQNENITNNSVRRMNEVKLRDTVINVFVPTTDKNDFEMHPILDVSGNSGIDLNYLDTYKFFFNLQYSPTEDADISLPFRLNK